MSFEQSNKEFIKNMLMKVGFKDDNSMSLLIEQTLNIFNDRIQWEILTALSENQMEAFDKLVSGEPTDEEIYKFFNISIESFDQFMDWLYSKFEKMYISEYKTSLNN